MIVPFHLMLEVGEENREKRDFRDAWMKDVQGMWSDFCIKLKEKL